MRSKMIFDAVHRTDPRSTRYPCLLVRSVSVFRTVDGPFAEVAAWCPYCEVDHCHSGDQGGHRVEHCRGDGDNPFRRTGYCLVIPRKLLAELPEPFRAGWKDWTV
jgi:hypothetical protein